MRALMRSIHGGLWRHVAVLAILATVFRAFLLEEEEEGYGLVGEHARSARRARPDGMLDHEKAYLDTVGDLIGSYSRTGENRLRRFNAMSTLAILSTVGVPVAVAAHAPGWAVALLGAGAAALQGIGQILQDHRIGTESHAIAVQLTKAVRGFRYQAGVVTDADRRLVFTDFVGEVEKILDSSGAALLEIMRAAPAAERALTLDANPPHPSSPR